MPDEMLFTWNLEFGNRRSYDCTISARVGIIITAFNAPVIAYPIAISTKLSGSMKICEGPTNRNPKKLRIEETIMINRFSICLGRY